MIKTGYEHVDMLLDTYCFMFSHTFPDYEITEDDKEALIVAALEKGFQRAIEMASDDKGFIISPPGFFPYT